VESIDCPEKACPDTEDPCVPVAYQRVAACDGPQRPPEVIVRGEGGTGQDQGVDQGTSVQLLTREYGDSGATAECEHMDSRLWIGTSKRQQLPSELGGDHTVTSEPHQVGPDLARNAVLPRVENRATNESLETQSTSCQQRPGLQPTDSIEKEQDIAIDRANALRCASSHEFVGIGADELDTVYEGTHGLRECSTFSQFCFIIRLRIPVV
jgi:hypothetical protein